MHEVHRAAELIRYEIADYARAVARPDRWHHNWAPTLLPLDGKPALVVPVSPVPPAHRDAAAFDRKRTVFGSIGDEFMQDHRHGLRGLGAKAHLWARNVRIVVFSAWRKLTTHELVEIGALPTAEAQQGVGIRQRMDAAVEDIEKLIHRPSGFPGSLCNGHDAREHVLHTMIEFGDEEIFMILGLSALGNVDTDADRVRGPPRPVVGEAVTGLNPPHLTVADNPEDTDKLAFLLSECAAGLGGQLRQISRMYALSPRFSRHIFGAVGQTINRRSPWP